MASKKKTTLKARKKAYKKKKLQPEVETYPHFRHYLKSGHPALITAEHSPQEYKYRKVMHGERDGRHLNEKVFPNPNKRDSEPMYIARRVRHDYKKNFGKRYPWKYKK